MLKGAVTEGLQVFAQFYFFFPPVSCTFQALQWRSKPPDGLHSHKANPTGLVSQLNSPQGFANHHGEICPISHTPLEKKRKPQGSSPGTLGQGESKKSEFFINVFPALPLPISRQFSHGCQPSGGAGAVPHIQMGLDMPGKLSFHL